MLCRMAKLIFTLIARIELLDNCERQNTRNKKKWIVGLNRKQLYGTALRIISEVGLKEIYEGK